VVLLAVGSKQASAAVKPSGLAQLGEKRQTYRISSELEIVTELDV
jgi:hypothetical protein